jgi:hypothetical protein
MIFDTFMSVSHAGFKIYEVLYVVLPKRKLENSFKKEKYKFVKYLPLGKISAGCRFRYR